MDINHASEIDEIFDAISYRKSASVIRMLQNYLGAECFQVEPFSLGSITVTLVSALIFLKPFGVYILISSNICSLGFYNFVTLSFFPLLEICYLLHLAEERLKHKIHVLRSLSVS